MLFCSSDDSNVDARAHLIGAERGVLDDCEKWGWLREVPDVPKDDNGDGDLQSPAFSDLAKREPDPHLPTAAPACRDTGRGATPAEPPPLGLSPLGDSEAAEPPRCHLSAQIGGTTSTSDLENSPIRSLDSQRCHRETKALHPDFRRGSHGACGWQLECPPAHSPWTVGPVALFPSAASVRPC